MGALRIFIGFDPRERDAYLVAAHSIRKYASIQVEIEALVLEPLRGRGLYRRAHEIRNGRLWDVISGAAMSTEFALSRFLVPHLCDYQGLALYIDCDFLFRVDVAELVELADPAFAVQVVKHEGYRPGNGSKMDGQLQTAYARKNWSSLMLWNCAHEAHVGALERANLWRGLSLHQLRWIQDREIGRLEPRWNWLEGSSSDRIDPAAVHFTRGTPDMPGYEASLFADEWRAALAEATTRAPELHLLEQVN